MPNSSNPLDATLAASRLEQSIQQVIRNVDVCTPYCENEYFILLQNVAESNAESIAQRIFQSFYNAYGSSTVTLQYEIVPEDRLSTS